MVCLEENCEYPDRFLCIRCSLTPHLSDHLKSIVLVKDIEKKKQLYQFLRNNEKLKSIYEFSKKLSTD